MNGDRLSSFFGLLDINKFDPKTSKDTPKNDTKISEDNDKVVADVELSEDVTVIDDNKEKEITKALEDIEIITNVDQTEEDNEIKEKEIIDIKIKEDIDNKEKEENIDIKIKEDVDDIKEKKDTKIEKEKENGKEKSYSLIEKVLELGAIPISLSVAFTSLGYVSILSFYRLYAAEIKLTTVFSWFFILYSVILVISRPIAGKIQDRNGDNSFVLLVLLPKLLDCF